MRDSIKVLMFILLTIPCVGFCEQYITLTSNVDGQPVVNQLEICADTITVVSGDKYGGALALLIAQIEIIFYCGCFFLGTQVCGFHDVKSVRLCTLYAFLIGIIIASMMYIYTVYIA